MKGIDSRSTENPPEILRNIDQEDDGFKRITGVIFTERGKNPAGPSSPPSSNLEIGCSDEANQDSLRKQRIRSRYSLYTRAGFDSSFSKLVVLKILLFDLAVSFGDAVTDILQGVYLICWDNEKNVWSLNTETWHFGVWVLIVCWVPGLVCIIHILSHHKSYNSGLSHRFTYNFRHQFFGFRTKVDKEVTKV